MDKIICGAIDQLLKVSAVSHRLTVHRSTIYRWFDEGRLRGIKLGRHIRIYQSSVDKFLLAAENLLSQELLGGENRFKRLNSTSRETEPLPTLVNKALALKRCKYGS
jgi:excisionase family DNA binding protein